MQEKKFFFEKTFENRNAAAVPLQRQSERRKFALLQEKNYGPTGEQKFQSKCDTKERANSQLSTVNYQLSTIKRLWQLK